MNITRTKVKTSDDQKWTVKEVLSSLKKYGGTAYHSEWNGNGDGDIFLISSGSFYGCLIVPDGCESEWADKLENLGVDVKWQRF